MRSLILGKFWREMMRGRLVARRWLENCENLNGIAMQNVYCGCWCASLSSVSLPVLEKEELSVCVNKMPLHGQKK